MEHIKILGYFRENEVDNPTSNEALLHFVAYENEYNGTQNEKLKGKKWVEGFNVIDGHFQLIDRDYLISCKEVSKEIYLQATKGYNTPDIYL